jgi:hypothetical protein
LPAWDRPQNTRACRLDIRLDAGPLFFLLLVLAPSAALFADAWDASREAPQSPRPASADTVPRAIRAARDRTFDQLYGPPPKGWVASEPDAAPIFEEIPASKQTTVAVVQFADYVTIRSAGRKSIYTEVRMNVERVLQDPSGTVGAGNSLTVIFGGGTLRLPSGKILREYTRQGAETGIQPGRRYLAFLNYDKNGDYFGCEKTWGLSGGVAVATYPLDLQKMTNGTSRFAGMPEDNFIAAVTDVLSSKVQ